MNKVPFGKTGVNVSQVSLGCMLMGSTIDKATSFRMLDCFVDEGGDFLDTANCYAWWIGSGQFVGDESETILGEWMKERGSRDKVFLATKVGARIPDVTKTMRDPQGNVYWDRVPAAYEGLALETIRQGVEGSLRRLQTDYIDLYYAHIDDRSTPLEDTLEALNRLVEEGKVRFIGSSNYRTWRMERAHQISVNHGWAPYVAAQQQYSYLRPKPGANSAGFFNVDEEMLNYFQGNEDVAFIAYSPLLKGIYDDAEKREKYYGWSNFNCEDAQARLEVLSKMAQELGVTNNQLVLAWLLHHQPRVIPILGFSSMDQYAQNMAALGISLTDEQMATLNAASA